MDHKNETNCTHLVCVKSLVKCSEILLCLCVLCTQCIKWMHTAKTMSVYLSTFFISRTIWWILMKVSTDIHSKRCLANLISVSISPPYILLFMCFVQSGRCYLKRGAYGILEVINGDKIWEERQDVLNLDQFTLLQELHCLLDVILLPYDMFGCTNTLWYPNVLKYSV